MTMAMVDTAVVETWTPTVQLAQQDDTQRVLDRDGKYPKLTPELYGAIIDEAHKRGLRVTAHIFAHRQRPQPEAVVAHVRASAVL
jgi:hypothetical protein